MQGDGGLVAPLPAAPAENVHHQGLGSERLLSDQAPGKPRFLHRYSPAGAAAAFAAGNGFDVKISPRAGFGLDRFHREIKRAGLLE